MLLPSMMNLVKESAEKITSFSSTNVGTRPDKTINSKWKFQCMYKLYGIDEKLGNSEHLQWTLDTYKTMMLFYMMLP